MSSLSGKSAVVTGGCSGIGYEVVKAFLEQGIKVSARTNKEMNEESKILIPLGFLLEHCHLRYP